MSRKQRDPKHRVQVISPEGSSPFLRGMLTHSLLKRGLQFDEAYSVALGVRQRLASLHEISLDGLRQLILETATKRLGAERAAGLFSERKQEPHVLQSSGSSTPFSRGLLSQRLVGTGLDPRSAYEVAQEVSQKIRAKPDLEIREEEFAKLVRQILVLRHGESYGKRLDAIIHIEHSDKPIIVLIGGATGSGKSTLATEIAYRLGIRKIASTDMIREIMRMLLSPEILPAIHASSYNYIPVRPAGTDPVVEGFFEQVERVEVGIAASIRRAVVENFNLVVEGVHLVPPMLPAMKFQGDAYVIRVILANLDRSLLESRFRQRHKESKHRDEKKYTGSIDSIWRIQEQILEMADQHDVPIIKNVSFDETTNGLLGLITDHLHRARASEARPR